MVKMIQEVLDNILNQHEDWLNGRPGGMRAKLNDSDLSGLIIENKSLKFAEFQNTKFEGAELINVNFSHADLCESEFAGTNIIGCKFEFTNLLRTDFSKSIIVDTNFSKSNIMGSNFKDAEIKKTMISFSNLFGVNMSGIHIKSSNIESNNCRLANFSDAEVVNSAFIKCELSDSNMSGIKLKDTKLSNLHTSGITGQNIINIMVNLGNKKLDITYWKDLEIWTQGYLQGDLGELQTFLDLVCINDEDMVPIYNEALELIQNLARNYNSINGEKRKLNIILDNLNNENSEDDLNWDI